jgi:hypothetical protein
VSEAAVDKEAVDKEAVDKEAVGILILPAQKG